MYTSKCILLTPIWPWDFFTRDLKIWLLFGFKPCDKRGYPKTYLHIFVVTTAYHVLVGGGDGPHATAVSMVGEGGELKPREDLVSQVQLSLLGCNDHGYNESLLSPFWVLVNKFTLSSLSK